MLLDLVLAATFVAGAAQAALPLAQDWWASRQSVRIISSMTATVDQTQDEQRLAALAQAQAYNAQLGGARAVPDNAGMAGSNEGTADIAEPPHKSDEPIRDYDHQLSWAQSTAFCWLEIPSLGLRQPVYRGTSDEALAMGVGHLEWTSLPVGGKSSHCVLAAHSGMQDKSMFDGIEQLRQGDRFVVHTLGDAYCYEVTASEVVLPRDAAACCGIEEGQDLCTLLTCTPYGINSHRLLVHARRCAFAPKDLKASRSTVRRIVSRRSAPLLVIGAGATAIVTAWTVAALLHAPSRRKARTVRRRPGRR